VFAAMSKYAESVPTCGRPLAGPHQVGRVSRVVGGGGRVHDVGQVSAQRLLRRPGGRAASAALLPGIVLIAAASNDDHAPCSHGSFVFNRRRNLTPGDIMTGAVGSSQDGGRLYMRCGSDAAESSKAD